MNFSSTTKKEFTRRSLSFSGLIPIFIIASTIIQTEAFTFSSTSSILPHKIKMTTTSTRRYMKGSEEINLSSSVNNHNHNNHNHHHKKNHDDHQHSSSSLSSSNVLQPVSISSNSVMDFISLSPTSSTKRNEGIESFMSSIRRTMDSDENLIMENMGKIIGAALLITSNTVGASMMALPSLASGPGLLVSSGVMFGVYLIHLFSGLLIAEVAINQYESSSCNVPSSFKQFADVNFNSESAGTTIATISMMINMCVLAYDIIRGGEVMVLENQHFLSSFGIAGNDMAINCASTMAAMSLITLVGTQTSDTLSKISSICCITLFISFAGLVVPGLASIHDPLGAIMTPGIYQNTDSFLPSLCAFAPIVLQSMVYQNIVPTIAKMLNYDRSQVVPAITLGSLIPMMMFMSFCFVEIGSGGAASSLSTGAVFMSGIKVSSLIGSAIAVTMSISQEVELFISNDDKSMETTRDALFKNDDVDDSYIDLMTIPSDKECLTDSSSESKTLNLTSVMLSVLPPLLAGMYLAGGDGDGILAALSISGAYGTPLLYGVVPVLLALNQRYASSSTSEQHHERNNFSSFFGRSKKDEIKPIVPGGLVSLGVFGTGAVALMSDHLVHDISTLI